MKSLLIAVILFFATLAYASPVPPVAVRTASQDVGIVELTNNNDGPRIEQIQRTAGIPLHLSYCMASVYTWYKEGAGSVNLTCPLPRTGSVMTFYRLAKQNPTKYKWIPVKDVVSGRTKLQVGDIIIWQHTAMTGHTGVTEQQITNHELQSIEGNTTLSNAVDAQREQSKYSKNRGGIFRKHRPINNGISMKMLGFVRVR